MRFTKMHGAGNDYVYVNCFEEVIPRNAPEVARQMSHRRFGVGADGLILIRPSAIADARMQMFNTDGTEAEMCGNGIRCVAKYIYDHGIARRDTLRIETGRGVLTLNVETKNGKVSRVRVDMGEPILDPTKIPTLLRGTPVVNRQLALNGDTYTVTSVSMGNPHCVVYVDKLTDDLVLKRGPQIEHHEAFPARVNVEFVEVVSPREVRQRTWERGSGETWACGTGASAVCVAGVLTGRTQRKIQIQLLGGDLELEWNDTDNHVYKTGPATEIFSGDWPLD